MLSNTTHIGKLFFFLFSTRIFQMTYCFIGNVDNCQLTATSDMCSYMIFNSHTDTNENHFHLILSILNESLKPVSVIQIWIPFRDKRSFSYCTHDSISVLVDSLIIYRWTCINQVSSIRHFKMVFHPNVKLPVS